MSVKKFVDTNILVYAHDTRNPFKQSRSQEIIFEGIQSENIVLSTQVLSEFYVTATKKLGLTPSDAKREVELLGAIEIIEVSTSVLMEAMRQHPHWQLSYWDALIIVTAQTADCNVLLSEDLTHGQAFGSLIITNPYL